MITELHTGANGGSGRCAVEELFRLIGVCGKKV